MQHDLSAKQSHLPRTGRHQKSGMPPNMPMHQPGANVLLWVALSLNIPVFDGADDVRLVRTTKLNLDLIPSA